MSFQPGTIVIESKNVAGIAIAFVQYSDNTFGVEINQKAPVFLSSDKNECQAFYKELPQPGFPNSLPDSLDRPQDSSEDSIEGFTSDTGDSSKLGTTPGGLKDSLLQSGYDPANLPTFENSSNWVEAQFFGYMENIYYPLWLPGYYVVSVNAIVQRANPSPTQASPNENTYQWDIAYTYSSPDGTQGNWEETMVYKTQKPYYIISSGQNPVESRIGITTGRAGTLAVGAVGWTSLDESLDYAEDAVRVVSVGHWGSSSGAGHEKTIAFQIEERADGFYLVKYLPNEYPNVFEVVGPLSEEEARLLAREFVAEHTVDVINAEREEANDEYGEAGSDAMDATTGVVDGDLGTISGDVPDRLDYSKYVPMAFLGWSDAVNDYTPNPFATFETTAELSGDTARMVGEPLFGYWDQFDSMVFEVAAGFKITIDVDAENFPVEEGTLDTDNDFNFTVILESGDTFSLDMGDRNLAPQLSIIVDGEEKSPYNFPTQRGLVDAAASVKLVSIYGLDNLFDFVVETKPGGESDVDLDDLIHRPGPKPGTGLLPGHRPNPGNPDGTLPGSGAGSSPSTSNGDEEEEDDSSGSLWLGLGLVASVLIMLFLLSGRSE
jgi:hypothetical protein